MVAPDLKGHPRQGRCEQTKASQGATQGWSYGYQYKYIGPERRTPFDGEF
jgi:hypothetical protein